MNLKYILIVWGAMLFCVGCSEDDVDSSYSFDVAGLKATVTNDKGSVVEMNTILLDSLQQQGFVGEVSFSEETRAENDRLAEEKFAEKLENIKNIKPARLFVTRSVLPLINHFIFRPKSVRLTKNFSKFFLSDADLARLRHELLFHGRPLPGQCPVWSCRE